MESRRWIFILVGALCAAAFLGLGGLVLIWKWRHEPKLVDAPRPTMQGWTPDPVTKGLADKISAFTLERTRCMGGCPVYVFRVQRDRKASFDGREFVTYTGRYTGEHYGSFPDLAYFAAARLFPIEETWHGPIDFPKAIVTVEMIDGTRRVFEFGGSEPNDAEIFCSALDRERLEIEWIRKEVANQSSQPTPLKRRG